MSRTQPGDCDEVASRGSRCPRGDVGRLCEQRNDGSACQGSLPRPPRADSCGRISVTTDAAAARRFYGSLLGWEFSEASRDGRPYLIARTHGRRHGRWAGRCPRHQGCRIAVGQLRLGSENLDLTVEQVQAAGGKVIVPPTTTGAGRASVIVDPQGAALGLLNPSREPPADPVTPIMGHFFWREYLAQDASRALDFYKGLLGFEASTTDARLGLEYFVLRRDGARAGLFQIPGATSQVRPHWLPSLSSWPTRRRWQPKSPDLGGVSLLEPAQDRRNGRLVVVADPTGGVVALQKFPI